MAYRTFEILARIDGEAKFFEVPAISLEAAVADIAEAYAGEISVIQYKAR